MASRIGIKPVVIAPAAQVAVDNRVIKVSGPKGKLEYALPDCVEIKIEKDKNLIWVVLNSDDKKDNPFHGLARSLIANMVVGVIEGYAKALEINGLGYSVELAGKNLKLQIGFANDILFPIPEGIAAEVISATNPGKLRLSGCDKQLVGDTAARIRSLRPPEPYRGTGIRYDNEIIQRKAGKASAAGA